MTLQEKDTILIHFGSFLIGKYEVVHDEEGKIVLKSLTKTSRYHPSDVTIQVVEVPDDIKKATQ